MALKIEMSKRTDGDGMENVDDTTQSQSDHVNQSMCNINNKLSNVSLQSKPKDVVHLKPSLVHKKRERGTSNQYQNKAPKFVPYEPYKAAVRPIVPIKCTKNVVRHAVVANSKRRNDSTCSDSRGDSDLRENNSLDTGNETFDDQLVEITRLREENKELEKQLKFQAQINGELKNLLVAAVGEDMEVKVNSLTEDKLHLAQALLNSAKTLSTHQEQVEWLASQCEVWRSKFLASSVMVEELARWKAALSQRITDCHDCSKLLLEERKQVRKVLLHVHSNLTLLRDNFNILERRANIKTSNILDLSSSCKILASGLVVQLLGGDKEVNVDGNLQDLPQLTEAERAVDHILKNPHPLQLIGEPDAACSAVVGAAVALNGQLFRQSIAPHITCCRQCTGKIKFV